jgi:geranylgeranyl diphosphate synthase type II
MSALGVFDLLKSLKDKVDRYIFERIPDSHEVLEIDLLYRMMRDYPSRSGKGLRPGLLLIFNRAFGGNDETALNTAAALELFQNWIVIHDDIEDQSDLRRGLPALHVKYGIPLALNAGDALAGKMWELILDNRRILGAEKAMTIFGEFLNMYSQTTAGQHIELAWASLNKWDITENDYFEMCHRKTAWYTCITPSWAGSLIAGAPRTLRDPIINFGLDLGTAFQIQDDVLNLVGEKEKYGKEIGGDILEGKRTLMLIHLLGKCTDDERREVLRRLERKREDKDPMLIEDVLSMMEKYGSVNYAIGVSQRLAGRARDTLNQSVDGSIDGHLKSVIIDLIDFIVEREF